ncbi:type I DNA topoisomerase [Candidatus Falkowbacteria bacterium CG10_big_fil_rev_8_21_14_0_10_39_11]|uniref:DNA topoisomerase 1 n=1 Tax=Candidatus Falkowbacteria bacterium CG10_big_fil_rev_8_21_14_0_10_39_11 TaxID=1974565 RepID=A0A2H0V5A3_9BACT|nr:MAG: type I DNA topoisomerase [Candidatus Falkowbacteria bacterium CG10_big_fil_rev_8_21_14_0_10_39_11]
MHLVIVESPTKAKTISKFLPKDYKVESSYGHVRDLPPKELGIDVDKDFKPKYAVIEKAKKQVKKLKDLSEKADNVILATDEDREGEAISWHLKYLLKPKKYQRITFHEITKSAIEHALENPRAIDENLVDAQQARRVLDRLVGFKLSPFLWNKVARGLSAGRVQSVTVRLIVEKEREREAFKQDEYWTIEGIFDKEKQEFPGKLNAIGAKTLKKLDIKDKESADKILEELKDKSYKITKVEKKETKKNPPTPLTTSTMQQAANNKLHMSAKQAMMVAQQLYEGIKIGSESIGLITYMRTDSQNLSEIFLQSTHDYLKTTLGPEYIPAKPVRYKSKSKGAQEAHEAIRPTDPAQTPESIRQYLDDKQFKLYNLIWSRTLATQMTAAKLDATIIDINDESDKYTFRANGQTIKFDGFLRIYKEVTKEALLPELNEGDTLGSKEIKGEQHFTQPPARYTEATLVKALEEYGIGRPSTYAPTIATVQDRGYVEKEAKALKPTEMGTLVTDILVEHFADIVDYDFTADIEKKFDLIEEGKQEWQPIIKNFYEPFIDNLQKKTKELTKKDLTEETTDEKCEKCQAPMVIKTGRFGKFIACSNYPECKNTKNINAETGEIEDKPELKTLDEKCPDCKAALVEKVGRFGPFIGCSNYPDCKYIKKQKQGTGVNCPKCETGEIETKRTRAGKIFYGCDKYPKCDFALWQKPTGEKCQTCEALITETIKGDKKCSNKDCQTNSKTKKK